MAKKRKFSAFAYLIIVAVGIGLAFVFLSPNPASTLLRVPGFSAHFLLTSPKQCEKLHDFLTHASPEAKSRVFKEILPLVELTPENLKSLMSHFHPWRYVLRLTLNKGVEAEAIDVNSCMQSLISRVETQSENLVGILLKRFGGIEKLRYASSGSWYGALVDACRNHSSCAKNIAKRYSSATTPSERDEWLVLLSQLNQYGAGEVMPIFENLPGLGLSLSTTKADVNEQANQMAKVVFQKLLAQEADLNKYLTDTSRPLAARWRVALAKAEMHNQNDLPADLVREALASEKLSFADRIDLLKTYSALAKTLPEFQIELTRVAEQTLRNFSANGSDALKPVQDFIAILKNTQSITWPPNPLTDAGDLKERISLAVSELLLSFAQGPLESPNDFNELALISRSHGLVRQPLPAIAKLLKSGKTMDKGFTLLISGDSLSSSAFISLGDAALGLEGLDRTALINRLVTNAPSSEINREIFIGVFPFLTDSEQRASRLTLSKISDKLLNTTARLAAREDLASAVRITFTATLSKFNFKDAKANTYVFELNRGFTCTHEWINTAHALTLLGPKTAGFEAAVFKLLSCPQDMVDTKFLKNALLDKQARRRIQDFLNASRRTQATERQLSRLTEILSYANRVPGSTMPPKIKTESQGATPTSSDQ